MSEDSRTIDFAKTASIDMMALNNKVVNMRQVVKRTKVHVINKLCKNITALKKKKGTDEQKAQNLKKAGRFIEEIESIKHLKEDKVSKYALANTTTFDNVSKVSTSAGPRALARLADHPLMQKVVEDFRSKHSDWRDLAAYLLVKQTGRRFKTKKQKQSKKLSKNVENINASETMTKAYIQERFGKAGLEKAEQRFERKRKREANPQVVKLEDAGEDDLEEKEDQSSRKRLKSDVAGNESEGSQNTDSDDSEEAKAGLEKVPFSDHKMDDLDSEILEKDKEKQREEISDGEQSVTVSSRMICKRKKNVQESQSNETRHSDLGEVIMNKEHTKSKQKKSSHQNDLKSSTRLKESTSEDAVTKSAETEMNWDQNDSKNLSVKKKECVVKELDFEKSTVASSNDEDSTSESTEDVILSDSGSEDESSSKILSSSAMSKRQIKKAKTKNIPSFLTSHPRKPESDPFFAGSDDEVDDEDETYNDFDDALGDDHDDNDAGFSRKIQSAFYNPQGERFESRAYNAGRAERGRGRWPRKDFRGRGRGDRSMSDGRRGGGGRGSSWERGSKRDGALYSRHDGGYSNRGHTKFNSSTDAKSRKFDDTNKPAEAASEKLHPSWEAKKKAAAQQSGIQAFKGSKITFDDDD